ncbi:MAG: glutamine--fructose-6-phosphate transaminase (isomerizing) [Tepidiphilus sp.]
MCGIVAAIGRASVVEVLLEGLAHLEYRGYDSAGLAVIDGEGRIARARVQGRVAQLRRLVAEEGLDGLVGIAHTRWATHGAPSERNAHPHVSGTVAVVHNGIIENFAALRARLEAEGYVFTSETDTEVIAHLVASKRRAGAPLFAAVQAAMRELEGAFAIAVLDAAVPGEVVVARRGSPLVLGLGEEGFYAASDVSALVAHTRRVVYLEEGDCARLTLEGVQIVDESGETVERPVRLTHVTADAVQLAGYRHYMQKEIFEQPEAVADTLEAVAGGARLGPALFGPEAEETFAAIDRVLILACGTSFHAGMVGRYWLEEYAGLPTTVEIASEYRYRVSVPDAKTLVVAISQSGETADTLAALRHAQGRGMTQTLAICNVPESAIVRTARLAFLTRAGPEIGVASTKAFTTQLTALALLALTLAKQRGRLPEAVEANRLDALRRLPAALGRVLQLEPQIEQWAQRFAERQHALFLGRGTHWPIALEGALKLKEISYIHAEGYPAGELKHGPLALVDREMPVVAVAPRDDLLEKLKSNLQEVRARGAELFVFAEDGSGVGGEEGVHAIVVPSHDAMLAPILHVVPLQLLAYHVALVKGTDVDKPRNLAKSVTVE